MIRSGTQGNRRGQRLCPAPPAPQSNHQPHPPTSHPAWAPAETWILTKKMMREGAQRVAFTVPIFEPLPSQYYIRVVSDSVGAAACCCCRALSWARGALPRGAASLRSAREKVCRPCRLSHSSGPVHCPLPLQWLGAEALLAVSFKGLILPERHPPHTGALPVCHLLPCLPCLCCSVAAQAPDLSSRCLELALPPPTCSAARFAACDTPVAPSTGALPAKKCPPLC